MPKPSAPPHRVLGVFTLAMINVALIASLRTLPITAEEGFSAIFFYLVAAVIFFLPTALISAELASGWPKTGGVYVWVKEAFGEDWGFLAIWLQWIQNVVWYPTALSFISATLTYLFDPALAQNKLYTISVVLVVYWAGTFVNFRGMRLSGWVSTLGVMGGTLLPGALIIGLGVYWLLTGHPSQIAFTSKALIPDMAHVGNIVFLAGVILALAGMEVSAAHAQEVKDPQRDYPRSILLATALILVIFILGSLAISIVVPQKDISLVAGLMEAFEIFLMQYHLHWLLPPIALLIAAGGIGQVTSWVIGPSKGLFATAMHGDLPPFFQYRNRYKVPTHILWLQGLIVTALSLVFLFMPDVNSSYWILTALTTQLYLVMYVLLYLAAVWLRYKRPEVPRPYRIPGGLAGMWITAGIGVLGAFFVIFIGFFPPAQLATGSVLFYESFLALGVLIFCGVPFVIRRFKKPHWQPAHPPSEE